MKKLKVIVSVTNDLSTDQRVHKVCETLLQQNFDVLLVGRLLKNSLPLTNRFYNTKRIKLWFTKGTLFYAEYQIRLFFFLLLNRFDVAHANDLDTLLPNYLASKIKGKHLVYDTHEYFTEVPELQENPIKKNIWLTVEKLIFPKLKHVFTVNKSIAEIYEKLYNVPVNVMRNVPIKATETNSVNFDLPSFLIEKKYIILQGAGINIDRGAEELVAAMDFVQGANLLIIGDGDVLPQLKQYVVEQKMTSKVFFLPKQSYATMMHYTKNAAVGVTIDKDTNLNYRYSLPNKLFDYVRAGIPVLASPLVETERIFNEFEIGCLLESHQAQSIADKLNFMISNDAPLQHWKKNLTTLSEQTNWDNEAKILVDVYKTIH